MDGNRGEVGFVLAFVVERSGYTGGTAGRQIRSGAFSEPPGEVFGFLRGQQPGDGYARVSGR